MHEKSLYEKHKKATKAAAKRGRPKKGEVRTKEPTRLEKQSLGACPRIGIVVKESWI